MQHQECEDKLHCEHMVPPDANSFEEGDRLVTVKEIHQKIPVGTSGEVTVVRKDINYIEITWNIPEWPFIRITKGTPTNGYEKVAL